MGVSGVGVSGVSGWVLAGVGVVLAGVGVGVSGCRGGC